METREPAVREVFESGLKTVRGRRGPVILPRHAKYGTFGDRVSRWGEFELLRDPVAMEREVWRLCRLHGIDVDEGDVTYESMWYPRFGGECTVYLIDPEVARRKGVAENTDVNLRPRSVLGPCIVVSEELVRMCGHFEHILEVLSYAVDVKDDERGDPQYMLDSLETYRRSVSWALRDLEVACIGWQEAYNTCQMDYGKILRLFEASYDAPAVETGVADGFV